MSRVSPNMEKTYAFIFIYALMVFLWLLGHLMGKEVSLRRIETLNAFECPSDGSMVNKYDCKRFNLEKDSDLPFFFESEMPIFDLNISVRIFRQTGLAFNEDRTVKIEGTLMKLELNSDREIAQETPEEIALEFQCNANEWICGPLPLIVEDRFPSGKHYYALQLKDNDKLFETVRHIELTMERFDEDYQQYIVYFKLGMFVLALIGTGLYYRTLRTVSSSNWSIEQIWILFLSVAVICFNDPLSLLYYSMGMGFLMFFSRLLLVVGLGIILPFWIAILRSLRLKQQSRFLTFTETIFAGVNLFFATICTLFAADSPSFFFTLYKGLNYFTAALIIYQVIQNLVNLRKLLWVDKLFMLVTLYFAAAYFGLIYQWSTPIDVYSRNYAKLLAMICLFTVYMLMAQYLYAVRREPIGKSVLDISVTDRKAYDKLEEDIEKTDFSH